MRHRKGTKHLNRTSSHRLAMRRNLTRSLIESFGGRGYIITTREKAKYARPFAEKLVTLARQKTLSRYRVAVSRLHDKKAVRKLFDEIGPFYQDRPGGYTRILATSRRRLGDNARQVIFGFVPAKKTRAEPEADGE